MYEHRSQPLLPRRLFIRRMVKHGVFSLCVVFVSLGLGIVGYHVTEGFSWLDALLNASMILGGMGPVNELHTVAGKFFASAYALFSGVAFLATVGILMVPLAHRLLHSLHVEARDR
jgi:hypothetical protein